MPWHNAFRLVDGHARPRFQQEQSFDCSMACLAMIDARLAIAADPDKPSFITNNGYKLLHQQITKHRKKFADPDYAWIQKKGEEKKFYTFKDEPDFSKAGIYLENLQFILALYGISCEVSNNAFSGAEIAGLHRRPIIAWVTRHKGGNHVVVCDGFTKDEKNLIVCDPDKDTDVDNTCLSDGIDPDKGSGGGKAPVYRFGKDDVGEFRGPHLYGFKRTRHYKNSAITRWYHTLTVDKARGVSLLDQ